MNISKYYQEFANIKYLIINRDDHSLNNTRLYYINTYQKIVKKINGIKIPNVQPVFEKITMKKIIEVS